MEGGGRGRGESVAATGQTSIWFCLPRVAPLRFKSQQGRGNSSRRHGHGQGHEAGLPSMPSIARLWPAHSPSPLCLFLLLVLLLRCGLGQNVPGAFQLMLRRLCNRVWHLALMARADSAQWCERKATEEREREGGREGYKATTVG